MYQRREITAEEIAVQKEYCAKIRTLFNGEPRYALVDTYGCQQNESDSEILRGWLRDCGYTLTQDEKQADFIAVNTCAVREHAEMRVLGNVGAMAHRKAANPRLLVAVGGCMAQQERMREKLKDSFRMVDIVFGPHELWRIPEFLYTALQKQGRKGNKSRVFMAEPSDGVIAEGLPRVRDNELKAWLSIMNGCDNFCTYCIVPYVRGRERSRRPEDIVREFRSLVASGRKDITLLGQNVNSYGKGLPDGVDFPDLLRMLDETEGDYVLRFMTSHPKDASEKLFRVMADSRHCAHHIHLPLQSGSDRILKEMNRHYNRETYLRKVAMAREAMPDLVLTTDIIVGFPGETDEDFEQTLEVVEQVRYDAMFTFIYSPRPGTPAATAPDPFTREQKQAHFDRLLDSANRISKEIHNEYIGRSLRVLVDGETGNPEHNLSARTRGGRLVHLSGPVSLTGQFTQARITAASTWALFGEAE